MADEVVKTVRSWQAGQAVNVPDTMQFFASQMMGLGIAGCPVDHHFDVAKKFAHTYLGAAVGGFPGFFRKLPAYQRAREATFGFLRGVIEHHRQNLPGKSRSPDLIDMPLGEMDMIARAHLPYTNSLVYAGGLAGFILYELLRHPDILKKVCEEILTSASDQYSLGVVLYHMLTGQLPFDRRASLTILHMKITQPPPSLRAFRPQLSALAEQVVFRALAKQPEERFDCCMAFAEAFQKSIPAYPVRERFEEPFGNRIDDALEKIQRRKRGG